MDELFCNKAVENATVFEFGYIAEPQQFEVRQIRFHLARLTGGGEFEAATFIKRGKRKEKTVAVNQLVVIQGWGHPKLDTNTTRTAYGKAKFAAFSNKWDDLLDQHLASLGPRLQLIVDGRKRPQLTRRPERGSQSAESSTHSSSTPDMERRTKAKLHRNEAARLKEKWGIDAVQVRYRETGNWYATLKRFPAALIDLHGYILIPTEEAYRTPSPYINIGKQIGVPKGISAIPGYRRFSFSELIDSTVIADIKKIESDKTTDPTTKQALCNARVGQGKFGSDVRELWNHRCAVTGSFTTAVLEASHIKRWADSNDTERLDPNNGLLLTANLHKLFDAGLISFEDSGNMLVSSKLSSSEQEVLGVIGTKLSKKPSAETANYLSYHRSKFLA
jgi:hypothetical protein